MIKPFHYFFDSSLKFIFYSPRLFILVAVSILYDILTLIVFFRIWRVKIDLFFKLFILLATIGMAWVGFILYVWMKRRYGVNKKKPRK
jgi:hypothetical protein